MMYKTKVLCVIFCGQILWIMMKENSRIKEQHILRILKEAVLSYLGTTKI